MSSLWSILSIKQGNQRPLRKNRVLSDQKRKPLNDFNLKSISKLKKTTFYTVFIPKTDFRSKNRICLFNRFSFNKFVFWLNEHRFIIKTRFSVSYRTFFDHCVSLKMRSYFILIISLSLKFQIHTVPDERPQDTGRAFAQVERDPVEPGQDGVCAAL